MKLLKKIFVTALAAFCTVAVCAAFAACGDSSDSSSSAANSSVTSSENVADKYAEEDDDTNWDYTTYIVYLQLPDGTPVANLGVEICSNGEGGGCHAITTNSDGRADTSFDVSQKDATVYFHFSDVFTESGWVEYECPDGYTYPANWESDYDGHNHVWFLTSKVTTLTFVAE